MAGARYSILYGPGQVQPATMGFAPPGLDGDLVLPPTRDWFAWRLLGGNNRAMGNGVASFGSRFQVVEAIDWLRGAVMTLYVNELTDPRAGLWGWRLESPEGPVVASPRWYEHAYDCRRSVQAFLAVAAGARVADGITVLRDRRGPGTLAIEAGQR